MGKYDYVSSGDLEHLKFLFNAPERPCRPDDEETWNYMEWLEWQLDSQAAHNRINKDHDNYLKEKCEALEAHLKKMTEVKVDEH